MKRCFNIYYRVKNAVEVVLIEEANPDQIGCC